MPSWQPIRSFSFLKFADIASYFAVSLLLKALHIVGSSGLDAWDDLNPGHFLFRVLIESGYD